jgi:hypothetical protein
LLPVIVPAHPNRQSSPTRWLSKRVPCGPEPERRMFKPLVAAFASG